MNSIFPYLYTFEIYVPTLFRLVLAVFLLFQAYYLFNAKAPSAIRATILAVFDPRQADAVRILVGTLRVIAGILLILGALTQTAALIAAILFALRLLSHTYRFELSSTDTLLFLMAISLAILGPGAYALDFPF